MPILNFPGPYELRTTNYHFYIFSSWVPKIWSIKFLAISSHNTISKMRFFFFVKASAYRKSSFWNSIKLETQTLKDMKRVCCTLFLVWMTIWVSFFSIKKCLFKTIINSNTHRRCSWDHSISTYANFPKN